MGSTAMLRGCRYLVLAVCGLAHWGGAWAAGDGEPSGAAGPPGPPPPVASAGVDPRWAFMSFAMAGEKVVKGAPYSAQSVYEFHQELSDGNRIDRSRTTLLYRDSEGRTRQELPGTPVRIFINDPAAGKRFLLEPEAKIAVLLAPEGHGAPPGEAPAPGLLASIGTTLHRAWGRVANIGGWGGATAPPDRGPGAAPAGRPPRPAPDGGPGGPGDWHGGEGPPPPGGPGPGPGAFPPSLPLVFREPRGPGVVTTLGPKEFDSVRAEGSRTTWTIAAGQLGNEKPIVVTSDQWYAPDLLLIVYTRDFDPRDGERIYQLKDLKRAEPPAELFAVPADYVVESASRMAAQAGSAPPPR